MTDNEKCYGRAFFLTTLLAGLYVALHYLPLPTAAHAVFSNAYFWKVIGKINLMSLGLKPVLSAFICLEVLSLVLPPLNRWRMQGTTGREKLNLWAWRLSFFFAFINALGTTYYLRRLINDYIEGSFFIYQVITIAALMGGTALAVFLARFITRIGVGNGFLILMLAQDIYYLPKTFIENLRHFFASNPSSDQNFVVFMMAVVFIAYITLLWRFIRRSPRLPLKTGTGKLIWFEIPSFPSSAGIQGFSLTCIASIAGILSGFQIYAHWMNQGWSHLGLELATMALAGTVFYNWFWGIDTFGSQVGELPRLLQKREKAMDRRFYLSMSFLLVGTALFWIPVGPDPLKAIFWFINLTDLIWYFGVFHDLWAQWKFWQAHGKGVELLEIDNMALASYLKGVLEAENVSCHFQDYHFRMLMLWLKPLFKVRLLVPEGEVDRAKRLIEQVNYHVV